MDISVSGLNGRLAAKLPPELPLGLVFVVGEVMQVRLDGFVLTEAGYHLDCRVDEPVEVSTGDAVRASGHLMFDSSRLQYFLLTRDIEVVVAEPLSSGSRELLSEDSGLLSALAAVKERAATVPEPIAGETLPIWVQKLAPEEIQGDGETRRMPKQEVALDAELVALLSAAMDSEEEMELTPELLAPYVPEASSQSDEEDDEVGGVLAEETAVSLANLSTKYQPNNRQDTDWLVVLLMISFFVLTIAVIVAIILLVLQ